MSQSSETHNSAQPAGGASFFAKLMRGVREALGHPIFRLLSPVIDQKISVVEPNGRGTSPAGSLRASNHGNDAITVLSANLWHDWPRHRRLLQRLEAFARLVETEEVDILLLQEVARTPEVHTDQWLAERLNMSYVYSRANGHHKGIGFEEGLAVFSRYPLKEPRLRHLEPTFRPFVRRLVLGAEVETPRTRLPVFSVHLSLIPSHNAAQVELLQDWVTSVAGSRSALIGGDFNANEHAAQIAHMKHTWLDVYRHINPKKDGTTHELRLFSKGRATRRRLDYIFFFPGDSPWRVLEARHLDAPDGPHSDHRAVLAKISLD
ncbi:MAG: endonuclease/exonuclease/phosphatase family protein [Anaerolineaceae bacterium]|nr:MAG: endonuclease/exonuclease/phosphatase family protein [Anaerolineaceae bacterium]